MSDPAFDTDAVIIGAGPAGLFQVFQLGLHDISCHIIDALPHPGGQCAELYPDKPIYDIPGVPMCTGAQLVEQLLTQIRPFNAAFHLGHEVDHIAPLPQGGFGVHTAQGLQLRCKVIIVAAGVGAFVPRKLKVDGIERFEGSQLRYHAPPPDSPAEQQLAGQHLVILGSEDAALRAALRWSAPSLTTPPASVTLVHRRNAFQAETALIEATRERIASGALRFVAGQPTGFETAAVSDALLTNAPLSALRITTPDANTQALRCDTIFALLGLSPKLGTLANWGVALERKQVLVDAATFESHTPGIFAVGDINTYPGKRKLLLCSFHEATLAAFAAAAIVHPDRRVQLQYTTTSTQLHQRLGIAPTSA